MSQGIFACLLLGGALGTRHRNPFDGGRARGERDKAAFLMTNFCRFARPLRMKTEEQNISVIVLAVLLYLSLYTFDFVSRRLVGEVGVRFATTWSNAVSTRVIAQYTQFRVDPGNELRIQKWRVEDTLSANRQGPMTSCFSHVLRFVTL